MAPSPNEAERKRMASEEEGNASVMRRACQTVRVQFEIDQDGGDPDEARVGMNPEPEPEDDRGMPQFVLLAGGLAGLPISSFSNDRA